VSTEAGRRMITSFDVLSISMSHLFIHKVKRIVPPDRTETLFNQMACNVKRIGDVAAFEILLFQFLSTVDCSFIGER
jgi:hypothetical protein